jgi:hypothetical protein
VVLFEATQVRELLLIFPNTFEYFFIFYELVRVRWNPRRMDAQLLIGAAAFIWVFIKLPQEWWIHVAQLDLSDTLKRLLGGTPASDWAELIVANLALILAVAALAIALLALAVWYITHRLPPADRPLTLDADAEDRAVDPARLTTVLEVMQARYVDRDLFEKVALVSLVAVIFVQGLGFDASPIEVGIAVALIALANTAVSEWLARRGVIFRSRPFARHFLAMTALNFAIFVVLAFLSPASADAASAGFLLALLTLIVTLYDRYRPEFLARFPSELRERAEGQANGAP